MVVVLELGPAALVIKEVPVVGGLLMILVAGARAHLKNGRNDKEKHDSAHKQYQYAGAVGKEPLEKVRDAVHAKLQN